MNKPYKIIFVLFISSFFLCSVYAEHPCKQSFIQTPERNTEKKAIELGYSEPVFHDGLNTIHQLMELGKNLRSRSINPTTTHIEDLEPFISMHIRHIQKGLIASRQFKKLIDLNRFKKEAETRIRNKQVTLYWWQLFNIRLSALATPSHTITLEQKFLKEYKTHNKLAHYIKNTKDNKLVDTIKKILTSFPEKVVLPATSSFGILALNQVPKNGWQVVPAELFNQTKSIEGHFMSPIEAHLHDFDHIVIFDYGIPLFSENPEFHNKIIFNMEQLPPEERKKAEVMYFILTHEFHQKERPTISQVTNPQELLEVIELSKSDANLGTYHILAASQLLNTFNDRNEDIYHSKTATDADMEILHNRYELLLQEIVELFTQIALKALTN